MIGAILVVALTALPLTPSVSAVGAAAYPKPLGARATFSYYFYWYDAVTGRNVDLLTDRPIATPTITWRGTSWHARQLRDMAYARIDVVMPVFWGDAGSRWWARPGIANLALALEQVRRAGTTPPSVAMNYDTNSRHGLDLRTTSGRSALYADVKYFFSTIPRPYWARVGGTRPIIWFFSAYFLGGVDDGFFADLRARFVRDFAANPYIVVERDWLAVQPGLRGFDATYGWRGSEAATFTAAVASVGPGYDDRQLPDRGGGTLLPRNGGATYVRALQMAVLSGARWLALETWNEYFEASEIAESVEYGRRYLAITRTYVPYFKAGALPAGIRITTPYSDAGAINAELGSPVRARGLTLGPSDADGRYVTVSRGGRSATQTVSWATGKPPGYLYFRVDDGFYFNRPRPVRLDVTYFDEGSAPIFLDYDTAPAASDWSAGTMYRQVLLAQGGVSGQWLTASIVLSDATFANHENFGADFRLVAAAAPLVVSRVEVTNVP